MNLEISPQWWEQDGTLFCVVFCVFALCCLILLLLAIWDLVRGKRPRIVRGKKGQGGPFTL